MASAAEQGVNTTTQCVVVNLNDSQSEAVGDYYQLRRNIPLENMIQARTHNNAATLSEAEFKLLQEQLNEQIPAAVQAYVLTWLQPYRVACMSITSAVALDYNQKYCSDGCKLTQESRYCESARNQPMLELWLRPIMMLAATNLDNSRMLIDCGICSRWYDAKVYGIPVDH
ncbi:MAG: TIGR03790 family protein [Steroidobacteraceae bacterium]